MKNKVAAWRNYYGYLSLAVLVIGIAACATNNGTVYVYQSDDNYVRVEPIEAGAPGNSHPFAITPQQLRDLLSPLKVSHADSAGSAPVFLGEELDAIVAQLAVALSKARPDQDVTFAVTGHRGLLGNFSPKTVTTGRVFVTADTINLIFGWMQLRTDTDKVEPGTVVPPKIVPGSRGRRIDIGPWKIDPVGGYFHDKRGDWVVFDRAALVPQRSSRALGSDDPG